MRLFKRFSILMILCGFSSVLPVFATDVEEAVNKVIQERKEDKASGEDKEIKEENTAQLKVIQEKQQKLRLDFEAKKKDLNAQLQKTLADYQEESGKPTRPDIIKENKQKQDELRSSFEEEFRKLQAEERKIRFGRESLERPQFSAPAEPEASEKILGEKEQRLDLQRRREEQDKLLKRDREQEQQQQRTTQPPAVPPQALTPPLSPGSSKQ